MFADMRKVTYGAANSLDNFIARSDDNVEWLLWTKEVIVISKQFWKTIDTVLMGRKTFQVASSKGYPGVRKKR